MSETTLGTWNIGGSDCTAALDFDWGRSVNISLKWSREPGPVEHEHLAVILPDILKSALESVEESAAMFKRGLEAIAEGRMCRSGIEDGVFLYEAINEYPEHDAPFSGRRTWSTSAP